MSREDVEIVARLYPDSDLDFAKLFADEDAMARFEASLLPLVHPSFETVVDPRFASLGDAKGRMLPGVDAFREMWRDWLSAWDSFRLELEDLLPLPDARVLALVNVHGRPKTSATEMSLKTAAIWTLTDGQVSRGELFLDRDEALRAAGLSE